MQKKAGFTAFELAVSLAVMALIAALVLPPYLKWLRGHRLSGAATNLMGDMEMAKIRAIRENDFVVIRFGPNSYTIFLDNGQPGGTAGDWLPAGESIIKSRALPAGVKFDLNELNFEYVVSAATDDITRFSGRGLPDRITAETDIPLINQGGSKTVKINRLGHMSVD